MSNDLTCSPQTTTIHTKTAITIQGGDFEETTTVKLVRPGGTVALTGLMTNEDGALSAQVPCNEVGIYEIHIKDEGSGLKLRLELLPEKVPARKLVRSVEHGSATLTSTVLFQRTGSYDLVVKSGKTETILPSAMTVSLPLPSHVIEPVKPFQGKIVASSGMGR